MLILASAKQLLADGFIVKSEGEDLLMIKVNYGKKLIEVRPSSAEELWKAYHLIDKGDKASAETIRIVKVGENEKSSRKAFLKIMVEDVEFDIPSENILLRGRVLECPEDLEGVRGHYHTLSIGIGDRLTLEKDEISKIHERVLNQKLSLQKYLVVAVELSIATIAFIKDFGIAESLNVEHDIPSKSFPEERETLVRRFFHEVAKVLRNVWLRDKPKIILIGPSVVREAFLKFLGEEYRDLYNAVSGCFHSSGGTISAVNEFLRGGEMRVVARELKAVEEMAAIEDFLKSIVEDKAVYGVENTWKAVESGAVSHLIVHVKLASKSRLILEKIAEMMRLVEEYGGKVTIVSGRHEPAEKLIRIGGIGAILRYRLVEG
jgi:protein pelota